MKNSKIFLLVAIAFCNLQVRAQFDVTILTDSSGFGTAGCPTPVGGYFWLQGTADNYNSASDSIQNVFYWGDGTIDTLVVELYEAGTTDFFNAGFGHTYTTPGIYSIQVISTAPNGVADTMTQSVSINNNCVLITGYTYEDQNSNCVLNSTDDTLTGIMVRVEDANGNFMAQAYSDINGYFSLTIPSSLSNLKLVGLSNGYEVNCPSLGYYTFNSTSSQSFNLGLECTQTNYERSVCHSYSIIEAPGDTGLLSFVAEAWTCAAGGIQDTVTLTLDSSINYAGPRTGPAPNVVNGQTLKWYFTYPASGSFTASVWAATSTSATIYDTVCFDVEIPHRTQDSMYNDSDHWCLIIDGPYDPNNKEVSPIGGGVNGEIQQNTPTLTYTVNFQNTGTAPAKNVYILDSISDYLDIGSMQILASSHTMQPYIYDGGLVRFDFPEINLPDNGSNEVESHGFVIYTIDLKDSLPIGTSIENTANIYFDYNAPIVTNTTKNTIIETEVVIVITDSLVIQLSASDMTCMLTPNGGMDLTIVSGNPPYSFLWSNGATTEDVNSLDVNNYSVTVTDNTSQAATSSAQVTYNPIHEEPIVGAITGPVSVQSWKPYTYFIVVTGGSSFSWSIEGGEILGTVNNEVEVLWHAGPEGKLFVTETDQFGCKGFDSTSFNILFVGIEETNSIGLRMFPNPTDGLVRIELNEILGNDMLEVRDLQGRLVVKQQIRSRTTSLDLGHLTNGIYTVTVKNNQNQQVEKLILQR